MWSMLFWVDNFVIRSILMQVSFSVTFLLYIDVGRNIQMNTILRSLCALLRWGRGCWYIALWRIHPLQIINVIHPSKGEKRWAFNYPIKTILQHNKLHGSSTDKPVIIDCPTTLRKPWPEMVCTWINILYWAFVDIYINTTQKESPHVNISSNIL